MDPPANEALSLIQKESDKQLDKLLLKDGRLISYKDKQGMTLLHRAAQSGSYNCSQVLIRRGADPFSTLPRSEWSPIHLAARDTSDFSIVKVYQDFKIDISGVDAYGRNILHIAAMHDNYEFLKQLLELKVLDVSEANLAIDSKGWTALHYASWHGNSKCVTYLLEAGANSLLTDRDGFSSLHLACESCSLVPIKLLCADIQPKLTKSGWAELVSECMGIVRNKDQSLVQFLKRYEESINGSKLPTDPFPLHQAVRNADLTEIKRIVNGGVCKINEKNSQGETSAHIAARLGLEEVIEYLINQGADLSITVRGTDRTALDIATKHHQYKCARLLGSEDAETENIAPTDFVC